MMGEKEFTAACMQLMFLAGSLDSGEFERLFKAILDDRAALVAHNAELEAQNNRLLETLRIIEGIIQAGYLKVADFERIERITKRVLEGADGG